jgi:ankyrin repeat protein
VKAVDGRTPLHCAAQRGHAGVIDLLVPGCLPSDISAHDKDGWTPLHKAVQEGHTETVRVGLLPRILLLVFKPLS